MKRVLLRAACLAACLMMIAGIALAQTALQVYVGEGALEEGAARQLTALLGREFPQAEFVLLEDGMSLRELVLSDCAPQLVICSPQEARVWAKEGLTLPLQRRIDDQTEMAHEVLAVCVHEENLFMAPLFARRRQMAVNVRMLERHALGYMLDEIAHPVWYPTEFQQILEEFAIADTPAMDVWYAKEQDSTAIEALIQAIYCGSLMGEDGETCGANGNAVRSGVRWLRDLVESELIGYQQTHQQALDRFIAGETAIFLDWTAQLQSEYAQQLREAGMTIETRPYPSASGLPVRAYELTGVSVLDSGDAQKNALAVQAAVFLHEDSQAQMIFGERGIFEDDSIWLWDLSSHERGATLRSLFCTALAQIIEEQRDIAQALDMVKAGMDTAR